MVITGELSVHVASEHFKTFWKVLIKNDIIILKTLTNYDIYLRQGGYVFVVVCLCVY